jgi:hypothetical protein
MTQDPDAVVRGPDFHEASEEFKNFGEVMKLRKATWES